MELTRLFNRFFASEKAGGFILIIGTILSLILANSIYGKEYVELLNFKIASHSLVHWINDGLMAIFFLLIGIELERELYVGELSSIKNISLPLFAAAGGMIVPAGIFLLFNYGTEYMSGAGIPMATDIAFAIGILSLLGKRVPASLKVFLTAFAVIDDLGAIIIIAIFYTKTIIFANLAISLGIFLFLIILNRMKVRNLIPYIIGGIAMWYFMHNSGVHATITGVLLAFAIPFGDCCEKSPSYLLEHYIQKPVAFIVLPLFAIANTAIIFDNGIFENIWNSNSLGIIAGLTLGKPLGIILLSLLGVALGWCTLPSDLKWSNIIGAGFLGGVGFTMSIFISILAYDSVEIITLSKIAIIIASLLSGLFGYIILRNVLNFKNVNK
jgi:Na+:H+ antiporter, NhaA family